MTITETGTRTDARVEWAVERTWPDGDVEYEARGSRNEAERGARCVNRNREDEDEDEDETATARAVKRTVTIARTATPWAGTDVSA